MADSEDNEAAPKTRVFISYSRKDAAFVSRLSAALRAKGYDAFLDREDISGGEAWKERIEQLILQADAVVFVLSPDSIASPVCDWETMRAVELGKRLPPVCWRRVPDGEAPEQLARLNYLYFDAEEGFDEAIAQLCQACDIDMAWVREHTRLVDLAARWERSGRGPDALLRGDELTNAEAWLARRALLAPAVPEALAAYLQGARAAATEALEKDRLSIRRVQRLQLGLGGLIALAAALVLAAGFSVTQIMSSVGYRASGMLAMLAERAEAEGRYDLAARYAQAGLNGADLPFIGFEASAAEERLRRAMTASNAFGVLRDHSGEIHSLAFSPDGSRLVTASADDTAILWNAQSWRVIRTLLHEGVGDVSAVAFAPDGARFATASHDGSVRLWDARNGAAVGRPLRGHSRAVVALAFSPNGRLLATASHDFTVVRWDTRTGQQVGEPLRGHSARVTAVAFSADGARLASLSIDQSVQLWDARSGAALSPRDGLAVSVSAIAFAPNWPQLATAGYDNARLWDARSGRPIGEARSTSRTVAPASIAFSPDGHQLAVPVGVEVVLVDLATSVRSTLTQPDRSENVAGMNRITGLAFSPNGGCLAAAFASGVAQLWFRRHATRWDVGPTLNGHDRTLRVISFSPDGAQLVTGSDDGSVRIWRAERTVYDFDLLGYRRVSCGDAEVADYDTAQNQSEEGATRLERGTETQVRRQVARRHRELLRQSCETTLAHGLSEFTDGELAAAPVLDPVRDRDVCRSRSTWTRLRFFFDATRR